MRALKKEAFPFWDIIIVGLLGLFPTITRAQLYATWYNEAQELIDTLRKGKFALKFA